MTVNDRAVAETEAKATEKFQRLWPQFIEMMDTED
jgi:hypothetical protein